MATFSLSGTNITIKVSILNTFHDSFKKKPQSIRTVISPINNTCHTKYLCVYTISLEIRTFSS